MREAAGYLIGNHDFRNFCKMDVINVTNFEREIYEANIIPFTNSNNDDDEKCVWMLEIKGIAFLWHMVRCIMAILTLVGEGIVVTIIIIIIVLIIIVVVFIIILTFIIIINSIIIIMKVKSNPR